MIQTYRCGACGNRTRFDVVERSLTRSFYHYTLGGDATIEEREVLEHGVESITCRWCGATDQIEIVTGSTAGGTDS